METTIFQRIRIIIDYLGYSEREFAKHINTPPTTINNYFSRGSDPSFSVIQSILNSFEFINSEWLIKGHGNMIKEKEDKIGISEMLQMISDLSAKNALLENEIKEYKERSGYLKAAESEPEYKKE